MGISKLREVAAVRSPEQELGEFFPPRVPKRKDLPIVGKRKNFEKELKRKNFFSLTRVPFFHFAFFFFLFLFFFFPYSCFTLMSTLCYHHGLWCSPNSPPYVRDDVMGSVRTARPFWGKHTKNEGNLIGWYEAPLYGATVWTGRYSTIVTDTKITWASDANSRDNAIVGIHGRLLSNSISKLSSMNTTSAFSRSGWSATWFGTRIIFLVSVIPIVGRLSSFIISPVMLGGPSTNT